MATGTARFDYLDGIRGIAIGAVLSLHWLSWYSPLFHGGSLGVDVFLVLSGFIITTMLWRSPLTSSLWRAWRAFLWRRVVRLYPALLGLVLASVLLYSVTPDAPVAPELVVRRGLLALGQASAVWLAVSGHGIWTPAMNPFGQTWSLAIEWYFYLLWPLAVLGARARAIVPRALAFASLVAAGILYTAALALADGWFYFGPVSRFAELLVGCALALWFQAGHVPSRPLRFATPVATMCLITVAAYTLVGPSASSAVYRYLGIPATALATALLIYVGYGSSSGPVQRLLSSRYVAAVGRSSYSLYLWHMVPVLLLEEALPSASLPLRGLIAVALTAALTLTSYRFLERPFIRPRSDVLRPSAAPTQHTSVLEGGNKVLG